MIALIAPSAMRQRTRSCFKVRRTVINSLFTEFATEISVDMSHSLTLRSTGSLSDSHHYPKWLRRPPVRLAPLHWARFGQDCRMLAEFDQQLTKTLDEIKAQGLYKTERVITTPQDAHIAVAGGKRVLNLCANNYLGLADHPALIAAAKEALDTHGFGMAIVRFICGTADIHRELESRIASYIGMDDSILFAACFDANGGVFEPLFGEQDAIVSDA